MRSRYRKGRAGHHCRLTTTCQNAHTVSNDTAHAQVLELRVVQDAVPGALPAKSGLLDAAKRCHFGRNQPGVESDDAVLERLADAPGPGQVASVEVRGQAELRIVRHADGIGFRLEPEQGRDGTESFLP